VAPAVCGRSLAGWLAGKLLLAGSALHGRLRPRRKQTQTETADSYEIIDYGGMA
jgi:hypothetical protein